MASKSWWATTLMGSLGSVIGAIAMAPALGFPWPAGTPSWVLFLFGVLSIAINQGIAVTHPGNGKKATAKRTGLAGKLP